MKVEQIYSILNTITNEMLGESIVVNEDLSNIVDVGKAFANLTNGLDNYCKAVQDKVGRMVFVNRVYSGRGIGLLRDSWEFGSILEKIRTQLPEAEEDASWSLESGSSVDPNVFTAPVVREKFFNDRVTWEIPMSITDMQVKESFNNVTQLNAFYSMIETAIQNSMTIKLDSLIMRTVNAGIAETFHDDFPSDSGYSSGSGVKAVNLLYLYNNDVLYGQTPLTVAQAMHTPAFIRYAALQIGMYADRLPIMSTLFNCEGTEKFTPKDKMHVLMLSEFKRRADVYLQSDTFHDQFTKLPEAEAIPFWQGSGADFAFSSTSAINVKTPSGDTVSVTGVLATMFDHDAMGVCNLNRRTTSNYNPKGEFTNFFHKATEGLFLDLAENIVVFYVA